MMVDRRREAREGNKSLKKKGIDTPGSMQFPGVVSR